jgi:hypothetical protein
VYFVTEILPIYAIGAVAWPFVYRAIVRRHNEE